MADGKKKRMKGTIHIDKDLCKGCAYCVDACPFGIIVIEGGFNKRGIYPASVQDTGGCTGCAMCAQMCPEIAIEVFREE